jgi:hypothetical protein
MCLRTRGASPTWATGWAMRGLINFKVLKNFRIHLLNMIELTPYQQHIYKILNMCKINKKFLENIPRGNEKILSSE